jgi:ribonuclease P protein component
MNIPAHNKLFTYKRSITLKFKSDIKLLFNQGTRINYSEIKSVYLINYTTEGKGLKIFITVPKRNIHQANQRNLLKRRIRESIRLHIPDLKNLCLENKIDVYFGIIYQKDSVIDYNIIDQKIVLSLQNIYNEIYEKLQKS